MKNMASLTYLQEGTPKMFYFSHKNQYPNFFFFLLYMVMFVANMFH